MADTTQKTIENQKEAINVKDEAFKAGITGRSLKDTLVKYFPEIYNSKEKQTLLLNVWNLRAYDKEVLEHIREATNKELSND